MREKVRRSIILIVCASMVAILALGCRKNVIQGTIEKPMKTGPIVYVALGDSTGAGVGAREGGYVARLFTRIEERRPGSKLSNLCVSGATTADVVSAQLEQCVALNPDFVTVGIGINDIGHGLTLCRACYRGRLATDNTDKKSGFNSCYLRQKNGACRLQIATILCSPAQHESPQARGRSIC